MAHEEKKLYLSNKRQYYWKQKKNKLPVILIKLCITTARKSAIMQAKCIKPKKLILVLTIFMPMINSYKKVVLDKMLYIKYLI